jgi:hypothetical protein
MLVRRTFEPLLSTKHPADVTDRAVKKTFGISVHSKEYIIIIIIIIHSFTIYLTKLI